MTKQEHYSLHIHINNSMFVHQCRYHCNFVANLGSQPSNCNRLFRINLIHRWYVWRCFFSYAENCQRKRSEKWQPFYRICFSAISTRSPLDISTTSITSGLQTPSSISTDTSSVCRVWIFRWGCVTFCTLSVGLDLERSQLRDKTNVSTFCPTLEKPHFLKMWPRSKGDYFTPAYRVCRICEPRSTKPVWDCSRIVAAIEPYAWQKSSALPWKAWDRYCRRFRTSVSSI